MQTQILKAPFPWFGGKSRVAHLVWDRFGDVPNYVEPFAGSLAVLLSRPTPPVNETVNDKDAYLANFWRALHADPEAVAYWADWPVNEVDLHARHQWLVDQADFRERMITDPDYYDAKIAGWWVWGISLWIGSGWCARPEWKGRGNGSGAARGVHRQIPYLKSDQGVHVKRPDLKRGGNGMARVTQQIPVISGDGGASGRGVHAKYASNLETYMQALSDRLRRVRVCCGDWKRILGPSPTTHIGLTGVFLDPPYGADRDEVYTEDSYDVAGEAFQWAVDHGDNPLLRIAVCGYEGEHAFPSTWECVPWKTQGGYANQSTKTQGRENATRERIWFSPHCLRNRNLFDDAVVS